VKKCDKESTAKRMKGKEKNRNRTCFDTLTHEQEKNRYKLMSKRRTRNIEKI